LAATAAESPLPRYFADKVVDVAVAADIPASEAVVDTLVPVVAADTQAPVAEQVCAAVAGREYSCDGMYRPVAGYNGYT
jgi:hypothetical protein